ncbi:unnamed protein product [Gongylonema pulchrum]|uniref:Dynein light chain n=1 Tax=Gongylonema pulchrum TaxID=637853 RepID=A0A183ERG8_9BILA|nr:unnamed protein product [Gongylonema pulchrum]
MLMLVRGMGWTDAETRPAVPRPMLIGTILNEELFDLSAREGVECHLSSVATSGGVEAYLLHVSLVIWYGVSENIDQSSHHQLASQAVPGEQGYRQRVAAVSDSNRF